MAAVYQLIDPRTSLPFYIGATSMEPRKRLEGHRGDAKRYRTPINLRLKEMIAAGADPRIEVLERFGSEEEALAAEEDYIGAARAAGRQLFNQRSGGKGGGKQCAASRVAMSLSKKRLFSAPEERQKLSDRARKRPVQHIESGALYESTQAAALALGLSQGNVWGCCAGRIKTTKGQRFRFIIPAAIAAPVPPPGP